MTPQRWKDLHDPDLLSVSPYFKFSAGLCADQPECAALDGKVWRHTDPRLPKLPCGRDFCGCNYFAYSEKRLKREGLVIE